MSFVDRCTDRRHVYGWPSGPRPWRDVDGWHSPCACGELTVVDRGDTVRVDHRDRPPGEWLPAWDRPQKETE